MKKSMMVIGAATIVLIILSRAAAVNIPNSNENINPVKSNSNIIAEENLKDLLLKYYKIDMDKTTMGEFKQILYNLIPKTILRKPALSAELKKDIADLYDILGEIGVTSDMTISQAKTIIENDGEPLRTRNINLICSIDILGIGSTFPILRILKAVYGMWGIMSNAGSTKAVIDGLLGRQYAKDTGCSGRIIGLIGCISMLGREQKFGFPVAVVTGFALFSISNVPFSA